MEYVNKQNKLVSKQSFNHPIIQSPNQSLDQSGNQATNHSITQSINQLQLS